MHFKSMNYAGTLMLAMVIGLIAPQAYAKKAKALPELNSQGEQLKERYTGLHDGLREQLKRAVPGVDKRAQGEYDQALKAEEKAVAAIEKAKQALGEIGKASGLVGHAKNHWIRKADQGIAKSEAALKNANTPAERDKAQAELDNWKKNRQDGVDALREREANYNRLKRDEPRLKRELEAAQKAHADAKLEVGLALKQLGLSRVLENDRLDARLAKFVVLHQATPHGLAAYAQQSAEHRATVDRLLANDALMVQMVAAEGAKDGHYGKAMQIYEQIQRTSPKAKDGIYQRLALAISLEHATPIAQQNPQAASDAPMIVDPVARYKHYEQAYIDGELDPFFDRHSAWALRFVVDGSEPDETLAWGRHMLRSYRPDHITTTDDRWRYVALVRTCVRYGSQENKYDKPELQFFQNILMNGGICGRRAFIGRFMLRAFGVPTVKRPQKGHAALARWTPDGWVPVLGAGWGSGWAPEKGTSDLDFLAVTQARELGDAYMRVNRAQWIADVHGEKRVYGLRTGRADPEFWNSVALNTQRRLIEQAGTKALGAVGEELGEANESKVTYPFESPEVTKDDRAIRVEKGGVIVIPAAATTQPTKSSGKIRFMDSVLGGKQLHYGRTGGDQDFSYTFDAPQAGTYHLTMRVSTPSWKQHVFMKINGAKPVDIELPHTVGLFESTEPIAVELNKGENVLMFSRKGVKQEVAIKGFTLKDFTLTPVK